MAHIRKVTKADGSIKFRAEILIKKDGLIIHRESKSFDRQKLAKDWSMRREIELQEKQVYGRKDYLSIKDVIQAYINDYNPEGRTKRFDLLKLQRLDIAKIDVHTLNAKDLIRHIKQRNTECKPQTAAQDLVWLGNVLVTMRSALDYKFDTSILEEARQVLRKERLIAKSEQRERRPTKDEIWKLARYFKGKWMLHIIYFSIYSARRISETTRIEMEDINHDKKTCVIRGLKDPRKKNSIAICKLPKSAYKIILKQEIVSGRVFPYNRKTVGKYFSDACNVLGIKDLHFHDLRHEATSRLFEQGLAIQEVSQVTLHKTWANLQRYVQLDPGKLDI
jgi:integrase